MEIQQGSKEKYKDKCRLDTGQSEGYSRDKRELLMRLRKRLEHWRMSEECLWIKAMEIRCDSGG